MSWFSRLIVMVLLVWIALIVVHPAADLPNTVLRSNQLLPFVLVICSAVVAVATLDALWKERAMLRQLLAPPFSPSSFLLIRTCIQRC